MQDNFSWPLGSARQMRSAVELQRVCFKTRLLRARQHTRIKSSEQLSLQQYLLTHYTPLYPSIQQCNSATVQHGCVQRCLLQRHQVRQHSLMHTKVSYKSLLTLPRESGSQSCPSTPCKAIPSLNVTKER